MRNLFALGALLAFMPVANAADGRGEFSHDAEYRVRYQHDQAWGGNKDTNTNRNLVGHRFKLNTGFKSGEKFGAHLTLLHNAAWGNFDDLNASNSATHDSGTALTDGINNNQNMVLVNQAYGTWMINDQWSLKFGRGGATIADGSVISQNDWEATPYAFDGVLANYEHEMVRVNLFGVKAIDNAPTANGNDDPEANFFGFAADWKSLPEFLKTANFHLLQVNKDEMNYTSDPTGKLDPGKSEMRYGIVLSGDTAGVDYKINYAAHTGEQTAAGVKTDLKGSMMAAEVGYSMPEMMKSRFHVAYHSDTGDDAGADNTAYDSFFYEKHGTSGLMDVVGWGNLTFIKAGYTFSPMDQVDVGLHYWKFDRSEEASAATAGKNGSTLLPDPAGTVTANGPTVSDSKEIGSEIDLSVTKKYDGGFAITAWVGMFMPGKFVKDEVGSDDTYSQFFVEGKMTF